jgi:hypothetical protein
VNVKLDLYQNSAWATVPYVGQGIIPGKVVERHLAEYSFRFFHLCPDDIQSIALDTPVRLYTQETAEDDWTLLFQGLVTDAPRSAEGIEYVCESFWYAAALPTIKLNGKPRVVYNARVDDPQYDPARVNLTLAEILADVSSLVQSEMSAWLTGSMKTAAAWPGLNIALLAGKIAAETLGQKPPKTVFDATKYQQALVTLMKWLPDAHLRIQRDTGAFHIERRELVTPQNITLRNWDDPPDPTNVANLNLNPRLDLAIPRIKLYFPKREEFWECYIDHDEYGTGTPSELTGMPESITKLSDLQYKVSNGAIYDLKEVYGGGQYNPSLSSGIITFRTKPVWFYVRYISESNYDPFDTGLGGTAYTEYGRTVPIVERYLEDFPVLVRKFWLYGVDPGDPTWLFSKVFAETYPDPLMWPQFLPANGLPGKTVEIAGKGASTIAEIAYHTFTFSGGGGVESWNAVGIRLAAAIDGAAQGDFLEITVEDNTTAVTALADALWKALRDVRWSGTIPAQRWMPWLEVDSRINLLNTNDPKLATFAEDIYELEFDLEEEETTIRIGPNNWPDISDLLRILLEKMDPQTFLQSGGASFVGGGGGGDMKEHKHDAAGQSAGGDKLHPKYLWGGGASEMGQDEIRWGENGFKVTATKVIFGNPTGTRIEINYLGVIAFYIGDKQMIFGNQEGTLGIRIDGIDYLFTHAEKRKLSAKVK